MAIPANLILTAQAELMSLAQAELRRAAPAATLREFCTAEIALFTISTSFFELAAGWQAAPPIFVRHIQPVQLVIPLRGTLADPHIMQQAVGAEFGPLLEPTLSFAVQSRVTGILPYKSYTINRTLSDQLRQRTKSPLDVRAPQQVLSVLVAGDRAYCGLSLAAHNLSAWAGGEHRFAREKEQISRAEFKLLEALSDFGLPLPPRGRALDLGAAPGGWTRILRQREQYVTAVDPGRLHPRLLADKNVRYLPLTAEAYLAQGPDQFDLIVNDMRLDARDSARLMNRYVPYLYKHGLAIMTLKLPAHRPLTTMQRAQAILTTKYTISHARHLFHNRQEITVALRPR